MAEDPVKDLLLPEGTRMLHIGPQKTGTTAVQVAMHQQRAAMREHGVVYPGKTQRPRDGVWAALRLDIPGIDYTPRIDGWHTLVREVQEAGDLKVCVSTEDFAKADQEGAEKVVSELGGSRAHVVAVARRLDRLFPSQWQQRVKMRVSTLTYAEWLDIVLGEDSTNPVWSNIWTPHDIGALVDRWVKALGHPARFTLIIADESDPRLLPRTFEQMLGLPSGMLQSAESGERNRSLGIGRIEAVRHLNLMFQANKWHPSLHESDLHRRLTDTLRNEVPWPDEKRTPPMPEWAVERVTELGAQRAELVRSLGVNVVGDPDNLLSPPSSMVSEGRNGPVMVSAELAVQAIEQALDEASNLLQDAEKQKRRAVQRARRESTGSILGERPVSQTSGRELAQELVERAKVRLRRSTR